MQGELRIPRITIPAEAAAALLKGTGRTPADLQRGIDGSMRPASRPLTDVTFAWRRSTTAAPVQPSWNVAGLLPGSDPRLRDETILVTSHYDHLGVQDGNLYPGANDNGSGTVAMLEVARLLAGTRLARSVLFVSFGSEEQLMLGSYHYVAHPLRPLATTRAVINLDMIGRPRGAHAGERGRLRDHGRPLRSAEHGWRGLQSGSRDVCCGARPPAPPADAQRQVRPRLVDAGAVPL